MTERRVLLASLLSIVCISLYSQALMRHAKAVAPTISLPAASETPPSAVQSTPLVVVPITVTHEDTQIVESASLKLEIGSTTGAIRSAVLKQFQNMDKTAALEFKGEQPLIWLAVNQPSAKVDSVSVEGRRAVVGISENGSPVFEINYELQEDQPVCAVSIHSLAAAKPQISGLQFSWLQGDALSSRQNRLEAYVLHGNQGKLAYKHFASPLRGSKNVPRGTLLALSERYFCIAAKSASPWPAIELYSKNDHAIGARVPIVVESSVTTVQIYLGPRDFLHLRAAGFEKAFPIGMLGQIGLALLFLLDWIAGFTHSYGIAIILFSVLVTAAMAPFTLLGFRSMKRMQDLKPEVDRLMAKHKGNPQEANKEVFALYKANKVSPLGGCLPMLLQMPIFIALFQAISHFISLRGASFLAIRDLSLPDSLLRLPMSAPLLGNTVNILPIIMAAAMYFQTQASQKNMGSAADNPTAQMMSGPIMPVLFLFMFYQFPAGLVLYWLTNSIMSMLLYKVATK